MLLVFKIIILLATLSFFTASKGQSNISSYSFDLPETFVDIHFNKAQYVIFISKKYTSHIYHGEVLSSGRVVASGDTLFLIDTNQNMVHSFLQINDTLQAVRTFQVVNGKSLFVNRYSKSEIINQVELLTRGVTPFMDSTEQTLALLRYVDSVRNAHTPSDTTTMIGTWTEGVPQYPPFRFSIELSENHYKIYFFNVSILSGRYFKFDDTLILLNPLGGQMIYRIERWKLVPLSTLDFINLKFFKK